MSFTNFAQDVINFVREHQLWALPTVFALAFGESLAFLSLLIPAWAILVGIGALINVSGIPFWPLLVAAALGAAAGDWLSYWFGYHFKEPIAHVWPLSKYPDFLPRGHAFIEKWGMLAIFIGRFFGPLRASVPPSPHSQYALLALSGRECRFGFYLGLCASDLWRLRLRPVQMVYLSAPFFE